MTIMSTRAQDVATILWELKRGDKLATLTSIAQRAGFSPGPKQNTISNCLKTVRRDWPHLEWWRAIADNGEMQQEQATRLQSAGYAVTAIDDTQWTVNSLDTHLQSWAEAAPEVVETA